MRPRSLSEKACSRNRSKEDSVAGLRALVLSQHVLLWSASYVLASEIYLLATGTVGADLLPTAIILLASGAISLVHIILCNVTAYLTPGAYTERRNTIRLAVQWTSTALLRLAVTAWLAASGMNIVFTVARQAYCTTHIGIDHTKVAAINLGSTCIVQRTSVGASLLCLLASSTLFILVHKTSSPYRAHIFGITKESALLPLQLPSKAALERAVFSDLSFKCRSSSSISSHTLVPSRNPSTTHLLPARPSPSAVGLGIYAPKSYTHSFLTPRPSLSTIRTHTAISSLPPPSSPLPPLPAYFPPNSRRPSALQKAVYPPRPSQPYKLTRTQSEKTVRIVPPSPALSSANLAAFNRSTESLSSVYSRSISGESRVPSRPAALSESSRTFSSSSTATVVKSPLGAMRLAGDPERVVMPQPGSRVSSETADEDIDDANALQARLRAVKAMGQSGGTEEWIGGKQGPLSYCARAVELDDSGEMRRLEFTPLAVTKTRGSTHLC